LGSAETYFFRSRPWKYSEVAQKAQRRRQARLEKSARHMNAKSTKERQRDHYQRMKAAGMKKICVYVPAAKVKHLRDFAAKLRKSD